MDTQKWITQIDEITKDVQESFGNLSADQLAWKPAPDRWSVSQCLEHLITVNNSYFPIIKAAKEGSYKAPWLARIGFITDFFGNLIYKGVQPDRKKRTRTFSIWEPDTGIPSTEIINKFIEHQEDLKELIIGSEDLLKNGSVISSPANRMIVYKFDKALDIIVAHEKRHVEQAREVVQEIP